MKEEGKSRESSRGEREERIQKRGALLRTTSFTLKEQSGAKRMPKNLLS